MYSPNVHITLLNTPLTIDGEHQIQFNNTTEQVAYFKTCSPSLVITDFTYQRKDSAVRVGINIELLYRFNYITYQNTQFSNKWFYSYITKLEYVNENVTHVYMKTDVFQTWFFDLKFNQSFVERMHETLDEYNTLSDTVPTGQLVESTSIEYNLHGGYFVFCTTDITQDITTASTPHSFKVGNYTIPCLVLYWSEQEAQEMAYIMQKISGHGWGDRILSAVYIPIVGDTTGLKLTTVSVDSLEGSIHICGGFDNTTNLISQLSFEYAIPTIHKKSMTFPYAKIVVTDMTTGQSIELSPEKFTNGQPKFQIQCSICETPSYKIIPMDYCGQGLAYNQALVTRCNTSLPVANNTYAKYMMMNGETNNLKIAGAGIGVVGSLLTGNASGVISGASQIMNVVAQENQASKLPNQVTALTDGAMERILFQNGVKISLMVMDEFHQDMADNYWKMFGYPIRRLSNPNLNNAERFKYIKMISPNIEGGNVPQGDMIEIENIFSKGVTLWNDPVFYKFY